MLLLGSPALAQSALPNSLDISRIEERLPSDQDFTAQDSIEIPLIHKDSLQKKEVSSAGPFFTVKKIVVKGSSVFEDGDLYELLKTGIGKKKSLTDLQNISIAITNRYREKGYVFSLAYVPQQRMKNNIITIQVIEGYIDDVEFRGLSIEQATRSHAYAKALKSKTPVKQNDLERYILLINDLYGLSAQAVLSLEQDKPGAVQLILLMDQNQYEFFSSVNNRGSNALGPLQNTSIFSLNDTLGLNEQTKFVYLTTLGSEELRYFSFGQSIPVGSAGTRLSYTFRRSDSKPGKQSADFDIESASNSVSFALFHPWLRSRKENLSTNLKLDIRNSSTESFDDEIIDDHLRYIRLNAKYSNTHSSGLSTLDITASKGLNAYDSTPDNSLKTSRVGAKASSSKIQASISRRQIINNDWSMRAKLSGQMAFNSLLSAELFGVGGSEFGRAFDFSSITGDHGYAGYVELIRAIRADKPYINKIDVYGVIDGGRTYNIAQPLNENWNGLSSTALGVKTRTFDHLYADFEVSKPLWTDAAGFDRDLQLNASMGFKYAF